MIFDKWHSTDCSVTRIDYGPWYRSICNFSWHDLRLKTWPFLRTKATWQANLSKLSHLTYFQLFKLFISINTTQDAMAIGQITPSSRKVRHEGLSCIWYMGQLGSILHLYNLTQCSLVIQSCIVDNTQHRCRQWPIAYLSPSHYLN